MDTLTKARYEMRASIIKAIAHPSRLFIVEELQKNERNVGDLTDLIGADTSTVSKHLSILKNIGIVGHRREGTSLIYYLRTPCILKFIGCVEDVMKQNATEQTLMVSTCQLN